MEEPLNHILEKKVKKALKAGFKATTNFSNVRECDALIICVPTPLNKHKEPDLSYVTQTVDNFLPFLKKGANYFSRKYNISRYI